MIHNSIFRITGQGGVACSILAAAAENAAALRPLAQFVQQSEQRRKDAKFSSALTEQHLDKPIAVAFQSGNVVEKKFRQVLIDLSAGREPRLVFVGTPDGKESVSTSFTDAVSEEWIKPRANAGCMDCGGKYTCGPCQVAKSTNVHQPALASFRVMLNEGVGDSGLPVVFPLDGSPVSYLTNACGELTGHGDLELTEADLQKVAFEQGPGVLLPYIVEIDDEKYVSGNLEIAFQDSFWGPDQNFMSKAEALAYCANVNRTLMGRLTDGAMVLPIEKDDPGRFIVRVVVPLSGLRDAAHTRQVLSEIFGDIALPSSVSDLLRACAETAAT